MYRAFGLNLYPTPKNVENFKNEILLSVTAVQSRHHQPLTFSCNFHRLFLHFSMRFPHVFLKKKFKFSLTFLLIFPHVFLKFSLIFPNVFLKLSSRFFMMTGPLFRYTHNCSYHYVYNYIYIFIYILTHLIYDTRHRLSERYTVLCIMGYHLRGPP